MHFARFRSVNLARFIEEMMEKLYCVHKFWFIRPRSWLWIVSCWIYGKWLALFSHALVDYIHTIFFFFKNGYFQSIYNQWVDLTHAPFFISADTTCLACMSESFCQKCLYRSYLTLAHVSLNDMALDTFCYQFNVKIPSIFLRTKCYFYQTPLKLYLCFAKCTREKVNMDWQLFRLHWNSIKASCLVL